MIRYRLRSRPSVLLRMRSGLCVMINGAAAGCDFWRWQVMMVGHNPVKTQQAWLNLSNTHPGPQCPPDAPPKLAWAVADVANQTQVDAMMEAATSELGGIDIAVNNAGTAGTSPGNTYQIADNGFVDYFDNSLEMDVNVRGTLKAMHAQLRWYRHHAAQPLGAYACFCRWIDHKIPGVMVNIASICGEMSGCGPAYTASKWATIGCALIG